MFAGRRWNLHGPWRGKCYTLDNLFLERMKRAKNLQTSTWVFIGLFFIACAFFFVRVFFILSHSPIVVQCIQQFGFDGGEVFVASATEPAGTMSLGDATVSELTGEVTLDATGIKTITAGDVNGDGYDDFLVASKTNDDAGLNAGAAYLVYGRSTALTSESLGGSLNAVAEFTGEAASDYAGTIVGPAGDVNNDGYDDFLITAYQPGPGVGNGQTYLIYGKAETFASTVSLGAAGIVKFTGEALNDYAGAMANTVGDVNNDGYDDIVIGATANDAVVDGNPVVNSGAAYLVYGQAAALVSANLSTAIKFSGEATSDTAGVSVSSGDFNNDGYSDMLISASTYAANNLGRTYLYYGKAEAFTSGNLSAADAIFTGEVAEDSSGITISSAGDVNNDSYDDILIAASANDDAGTGAGAVYLIYGQASALTSASLSTAVEFTGEAAGDAAGNSVSGAGDVNMDGYDDFLVGAPLNNDAASDAGAAYLVYGQAAPLTSASLSTAVEFTGEAASDRSGNSVSNGGDINNDGSPDILISSRLSDDGAVDAGAVYVVYHQPPFISLTAATQSLAESVGTATVTAQLSGIFPFAVTIPYTVSGTATGGGADYTLANGSVTIPVGVSTGDITFPVIDDPIFENDETIILTLGTPNYGTLSGVTQQTATIANTDILSSSPAPDLTLIVPKTVSISYPGIGARVLGGSSLDVLWATTGVIPLVTVSLSLDNGATWSVLQRHISNAGNTSLILPAVQASQALLRVDGTDLSTILASGTSDPFSITLTQADVTPEPPISIPPFIGPVLPSDSSDAQAVADIAQRVAALPPSVSVQTCVKLPDDGNPDSTLDSVIYYVGADGYRHAFSDQSVYMSWYPDDVDADDVHVISYARLTQIALGENVMYRPGSRLVKFQSSPKVYAIDLHGVLRWIGGEDVASQLYGPSWNTDIVVIPDTLLRDYTFGVSIQEFVDFDPQGFSSIETPSDDMNIPGYTE